MSKKNRQKQAATAPAAAAQSAPASVAATAPAAEPEAHVPWIESTDPRKKMFGQIAYVAVWIYVAALCLLALDQTFHWGIFGPKIPPTP